MLVSRRLPEEGGRLECILGGCGLVRLKVVEIGKCVKRLEEEDSLLIWMSFKGPKYY